jgi:uncharacterized protein (TIGR01777 family)
VNITLTGASGLIGRRLLANLQRAGHTLTVLSRRPAANLAAGIECVLWDPMQGPPPEEGLRQADAIIHLAGEPVAQRWNEDVKRRIHDSRVFGTRNLVEGIANLRNRPGVLITASAIGYYGSRGDEILSESSPPAETYLAHVCSAWENEAAAAEALGLRVVPIRIGVVLDAHGGALKSMLTPFRFGLGGRLGDGRQWMSWIHLADLAALFEFALDPSVRGPLNGVAPNPVRNSEFTQALAAALHRPAIFPVPPFALKLLYGEMSEILFASQRVLPTGPEAAGFKFKFPELPAALVDLFAQS